MDRDRQIMMALARRRIEEQEQEERMLKEGREREEAEKRRRLQRTAAAAAAGDAKTGGGDGGGDGLARDQTARKQKDRDVRARQQARQQEQQSEARRRKREKKRAQQEARQKATADKARAKAAHSQRKQKEREERESQPGDPMNMEGMLDPLHWATPANTLGAWVLVQIVRHGGLALPLSGGTLLQTFIHSRGSPLQLAKDDAVWLAGLLVFFRLTAVFVSYMSYYLHDKWQWHRQPPLTRVLVCAALVAITVVSWCCLTPFQILAPIRLTSVAVMLVFVSVGSVAVEMVLWFAEMVVRFGFAATFIDHGAHDGYDGYDEFYVTVPKSLAAGKGGKGGGKGARSFMYKQPGRRNYAAAWPSRVVRVPVPEKAGPGDRLLVRCKIIDGTFRSNSLESRLVDYEEGEDEHEEEQEEQQEE